MAFTGTLNASILIQDTSTATPVTVASDAKTDQEVAQDEMFSLSVTVNAGAVNQVVALTGLDIRGLYVTATNPVTMKQAGDSSYAQPLRSVFCSTYGTGQSPTDLRFSNAGAVASQVKIISWSKNP